MRRGRLTVSRAATIRRSHHLPEVGKAQIVDAKVMRQTHGAEEKVSGTFNRDLSGVPVI